MSSRSAVELRSSAGRAQVELGLSSGRARVELRSSSGRARVELGSASSGGRARKGLWRGVGEPPLRGLYNVLASSSIGHHQFREEASTRSARIFGPAVSTSELPNEAVFPSRPSSAASLGKFQTIRRARREAGTRPRSPRFKSRAGTPHPPLHQPSGAESTTMNGSSRALVCELHERATRPTR